MGKINIKNYPLIAAGCYAALALLAFLDYLKYTSGWSFLLFLIPLIGLAFALFMKNIKAIAVAAGVNALRVGYFLIANIDDYGFSWVSLFYILAYVSLVAVIFLALQGNQLVTLVWVVPAALLLLGNLINLNGLIGLMRHDFFPYYSWEKTYLSSWRSWLRASGSENYLSSQYPGTLPMKIGKAVAAFVF